jgi:type VII secretion protein EccB
VASRRDQLQSYQFLIHRVISALVMRETDPAESPLRRGVGAVFAGFMIAVVIAAGFGVFGLLTKIGNSKWQIDGEVVVEKETGAVFLYRGGTLYQMANYASALLASGHTPPATASVSRNSLLRVPRGGTLGIPNAPNALPDQGKLVSDPWSACSLPVATDTGGGQNPTTVLLVATAPAGAQRLGNNQGLIVHLPNRQSYYLVYHGYKYAIRQQNVVLNSLYGANPPQMTVSQPWLNTLVAGKSIDTITVPDAGAPSTAAPNHTNGDLLSVQLPSGKQFFVVFADGLAAITELQKDVYVGQTAAREIGISVQESNNTPKSTRLAPASGDIQPPTSPPTLFQPASSQDPVCTRTDDPQQDRPSVLVGGTVPGTGTQTTQSSASGTLLANRVVVPAGQAALIQIIASPTAASGAYNVVTDVGVRYPVVSVEALAMLGYAADKAVRVPAEFANLVPAGPTLDPEVATRAINLTSPNGP